MPDLDQAVEALRRRARSHREAIRLIQAAEEALEIAGPRLPCTLSKHVDALLYEMRAAVDRRQARLAAIEAEVPPKKIWPPRRARGDLERRCPDDLDSPALDLWLARRRRPGTIERVRARVDLELGKNPPMFRKVLDRVEREGP